MKWRALMPLLALLLAFPVVSADAQVSAAQGATAAGGGGTVGGDRRTRINGPIGNRNGPTTPPPPPAGP
jgi:hypothetical protein